MGAVTAGAAGARRFMRAVTAPAAVTDICPRVTSVDNGFVLTVGIG
jgi:hypothetical protein